MAIPVIFGGKWPRSLRLLAISAAKQLLRPPRWAPKRNAVHFAIRMAALKSMRVVGCGVRGRNG